MNRTQAYAAAGPSHMSRLAPVDEEDESESGFDGYSSAGSGEDLADEQEEQGHETEGDDEDDDDHEYAQDVSDRKGKGVDHSGVRSELPHRHSSQPVKQTESRTWSELDLSMIIALVSPIGNWLTGSDHVKNLFLLLLLIFYLHQLVEVPWKLYRNSRPRRKLAEAFEDARAEVALSALRMQELLYLAFTVFAPFIGAVLIRHVFSAMDGVDSLSWFSTTLFVLATGIRPWTHLVSRLNEHTDELHQALHAGEDEEHAREVDRKLDSVMQRLDALELILAQVQAKADKVPPLQEVCDEISDALETVERTVHRQERKTESARVSHNNRLTAVESVVLRLEERQKHHLRAAAVHGHTTKEAVHLSLPPFLMKSFLRFRSFLLRVKHALLNRYPSLSKTLHIKDITPASPKASPPISPSATVQYFNGTPLETIPEAADSDSEGTYVSDREAAGDTPRKRAARKRSRSRSTSGPRPSLVRRDTYGRAAYDYAAAAVSWPYRFTVKVMLLVIPLPVQKYFA